MVGSERTFRPVEDSAGLLQAMLDLYWQGLTEPLRFFPAAAMGYAHNREWSLARARKAWDDGFTFKGEGDDPCYRLCFGQVDPFNDDFERIARSVMEPLLHHQL
jgi:exodeoxyribonuclease V gamma subunit